MNDKEVLEACIAKAIKGGWDAFGWPDWAVWGEDTVMFYDKTRERDHTKMVMGGVETELSTIFFNHDFCRHLWGEELRTDDIGRLPNWQHHITDLALAEDRIAYLRENA